jgi:hypothetical protein
VQALEYPIATAIFYGSHNVYASLAHFCEHSCCFGFEPQSQVRTFVARMAIPVPAATPANALLAPGSPWANWYPPMTIAIRLATFATVPVKGFEEPGSLY